MRLHARVRPPGFLEAGPHVVENVLVERLPPLALLLLVDHPALGLAGPAAPVARAAPAAQPWWRRGRIGLLLLLALDKGLVARRVDGGRARLGVLSDGRLRPTSDLCLRRRRRLGVDKVAGSTTTRPDAVDRLLLLLLRVITSSSTAVVRRRLLVLLLLDRGVGRQLVGRGGLLRLDVVVVGGLRQVLLHVLLRVKVAGAATADFAVHVSHYSPFSFSDLGAPLGPGCKK